MLNDFFYLWKFREKPLEWRRWFIVMIKRIVLFFPLIKLLVRPFLLRMRGGNIGNLVVLGKSKINGNLRNLHIGVETSLGKCEITLHDKVVIGRYVVINDGAIFLTASHSLNDPLWRSKKGPIFVGDYAWIATNAIILPNVTIGKGAVVGAGAIVRMNVPEYAVVLGNPATIQSVQRSKILSYSPVFLNAPFEAWIGKNKKNVNIASS